MIADLGSYALADFLPFSQATYLRLFALHNAALAPLHFVLAAIGIALLPLLRRSGRGLRAALLCLAGCWLLVGWAFHWQAYADLVWVGRWFALLFALGAGLLLLAAADRDLGPVAGRPLRTRLGLTLYLTGVLMQPVSGVGTGRGWEALAWFGTAPDPTATATAGLLLLVDGRYQRLAWVPVTSWLIVAALTALALDTREYLLPAAALLLSAIAGIRLRRPVHG